MARTRPDSEYPGATKESLAHKDFVNKIVVRQLREEKAAPGSKPKISDADKKKAAVLQTKATEAKWGKVPAKSGVKPAAKPAAKPAVKPVPKKK